MSTFDDIDIEELLKDSDLNNELRALGWVDDHTPPPASNFKTLSESHATPKNTTTATTTATDQIVADIIIDPLEISKIGEIDENQLELDENDMNDPELLSMFEALSTGNPLPNHTNKLLKLEPVDKPDSVCALIEPKMSTSISQTTISDSSRPSSNRNVTVEEAKRRAAQYRREGNTEEALNWFRLSKELAAANPTISPKVSPLPPKPNKPQTTASMKLTPQPMNPDQLKFHSLEKAVVEASNASLSEAKKLRDAGNTKQAVEKMKEHQKYQQELMVLRARVTIPHAQPPVFHYETTRKETKVEHVEIGEENLVFTLLRLENLSSLLADHSSRNVSVKISFGLPLTTGNSGSGSGKDNKEELVMESPQGNFRPETHDIDFNYSLVLSGLKRSKLSLQGYLRKRVLFEVILHRGFFRSSIVLAHSTLSYQDFASKCEIGGDLQLLTPDKSDTGQYSKRAKALGGKLKVTMKVRVPFVEKEVKITEERKLVIGAWPSLEATTTAMTTVSSSSTAVAASESSKAVPFSRVGGNSVAAEDDEEKVLPVNKAKAEEKFGVHLSEKEKNDPDALDFYVSNDVLEQEIGSLEERLVKGEVAEEEQVTMQLRLQLLRSKLDMLVYAVQNEQLSLDDYLMSLKKRVEQDQYLALYLKTLETTASKKLAVKVLKRKKVMEAEVQGAEENTE